MEARDLLKYKENLEEAIRSNKMALFFNDSILHAMMIMAAIFQKASEEDQKYVRMYCGEFSLFRDKTRNKVLNEKISCSLEGLDRDKMEVWNNIDFFENLQQALNHFLNQDGCLLEIIIANNAETLPQNTNWNIIRQNIDNHKIKIYKLKNDVGLDHFVTTTDSYRVENSDADKTAICSFRDKDTANILIDNFKTLLTLSLQMIY